MSTALRIASGLTRGWVHLYTSRMPTELREIRRAEIYADLWDHQRDAQDSGVPAAVAATEILLRTCLGVPDDLSWRFEVSQASRADSPGRRGTMIALSPKHVRWLGLFLLLGGLLWTVDGAFFRTDTGVRFPLLVPLLLMVGLAGFWAQQRQRLSKAGQAGVVLLFVSWLAWFGLNSMPRVFTGLDSHSLLVNLLALAWACLMPVGFLLLGIGLKGPVRVALFAVVAAFPVGLVFWLSSILVPGVLTDYDWRTANSPPPFVEVFLLLAGLGLALMGYTVLRARAAEPGTQP